MFFTSTPPPTPHAPRSLRYAEQLQATLVHNMSVIAELVKRKDTHYGRIKEEMLSQALERRQREEEVVNWSYVLKYDPLK